MRLESLLQGLDAQSRRKLKAGATRRHFSLELASWTVAAFSTLLGLWDKKRNGALQPAELSAGSTKKVWWKCAAAPDHVWEMAPDSLLRRQKDETYRVLGCPFCSHHRTTPRDSIAKKAPALARQWHPTRNGELRPKDVALHSKKSVWWMCSKGHEWSAQVRSRSPNASQCPYCNGTFVSAETCLTKTHPNLAAEWHPTKNGKLKPSDVTRRDARAVWWKCRGTPSHDWKAEVRRRIRTPNCPLCKNRVVTKENCLARQFPEIAKQWHPTRNGELTPWNVVSGSRKRVWWKCPKGPDHEWSTCIYHRTKAGSGCPCCSGLQVSVTNRLSSLNVPVARDWHPTKNGDLKPSQVNVRSTKIVWWLCPKKHAYQEQIFKRTVRRADCPRCQRRVG
ncbi:MAG: zinc-ribbon domain-containing protein [Polyangiaceae bacterium]